MFHLEDKLLLHVAPTFATAYVGDTNLFSDYGGKAQLTTFWGGLPQSVTLSWVYRNVYNSVVMDSGAQSALSSGNIVDLSGQFETRVGLMRSDMLYISPLFRYSHADGPGPTVEYSEPLFVADYFEAGSRVAYYVPVAGPSVLAGVGFGYHHRWYDQTVAFGTDKRVDDYIEPSAHLIFPNLVAKNVDFRLDYRYEHNISTDSLESFDNHVAGARVVGRF